MSISMTMTMGMGRGRSRSQSRILSKAGSGIFKNGRPWQHWFFFFSKFIMQPCGKFPDPNIGKFHDPDENIMICIHNTDFNMTFIDTGTS